jgi:hypothetical protein
MKLTDKEKIEMKLKLMEAINNALDETLSNDHNFGYIASEIASLMADASLTTLLAITATNNYFEEEGIITN